MILPKVDYIRVGSRHCKGYRGIGKGEGRYTGHEGKDESFFIGKIGLYVYITAIGREDIPGERATCILL